MLESLLFTASLFLLVYFCWVVIRASRNRVVRGSHFGLFAYKEKTEDIDK